MIFSFGVEAWTNSIVNDAPRIAERVERYDALPSLFLAETTESGAQQIARLSRVRSVRAVPNAVRRIAWSINEQVMIATVHARELRSNGVANAGTEMLSASTPAYPTFSNYRPQTSLGIRSIAGAPGTSLLR